jgi:acetate kinase
MPGYVATLNAGSSSIKFSIFALGDMSRPRFKGQLEKIGVAPALKVLDEEDNLVNEKTWPAEGFDHQAAASTVVAVARELVQGSPVLGIGHRVVHGGEAYAAPVRIDDQVLEALARLAPLAPLHQPHNLAPIRTIAKAAPHIPQVACFDTAFHRAQPQLAQAFALPRALTQTGVRRYGFHGLSYEYVSRSLKEIAPDLAAGRVIIAHLGNGASLCAVDAGRSVASTMGFTAVDGLMMGTRCGSVDPGVLLYLMDEHKMDARALEDLIYKRSGLLGVSGVSSDMRELRASDEASAKEAISLFTYRIVREIGSLAAALGGVDGLIFSGGIGENDAEVRKDVGAGCAWLGVRLDEAWNAGGAGRISADASAVSVWVVPTDEEKMIALHTVSVLGL